MSFLSSVFPTKKPTSSDAEAALTKVNTEHRIAVESVAKAEAVLSDLANLTDEQHASAEAALLSGKRAKARLEAQILEISKVRDDALRLEASADFFARRSLAEKRVDVDYRKVEAQLRKAFIDAAAAAAAMTAIDAEVAAINSEIKAARRADKNGSIPDPVPTSDQRYRSEPDTVTPASTYEQEMVCVNGDYGPVPVACSVKYEGEHILNAGEFLHTVIRKISEQRRIGRSMLSPTSALVLPPMRLDEAPFWPIQ